MQKGMVCLVPTYKQQLKCVKLCGQLLWWRHFTAVLNALIGEFLKESRLTFTNTQIQSAITSLEKACAFQLKQ